MKKKGTNTILNFGTNILINEIMLIITSKKKKRREKEKTFFDSTLSYFNLSSQDFFLKLQYIIMIIVLNVMGKKKLF